MDNLFLKALEAILTVGIIIFIRYFVPYVKEKIAMSKYDWLVDVISDAVNAAEQTIKGSKVGSVRKDKVVAYIETIVQKYHIDITSEQIDSIIESCVYALKVATSATDDAVRG